MGVSTAIRRRTGSVGPSTVRDEGALGAPTSSASIPTRSSNARTIIPLFLLTVAAVGLAIAGSRVWQLLHPSPASLLAGEVVALLASKQGSFLCGETGVEAGGALPAVSIANALMNDERTALALPLLAEEMVRRRGGAALAAANAAAAAASPLDGLLSPQPHTPIAAEFVVRELLAVMVGAAQIVAVPAPAAHTDGDLSAAAAAAAASEPLFAVVPERAAKPLVCLIRHGARSAVTWAAASTFDAVVQGAALVWEVLCISPAFTTVVAMLLVAGAALFRQRHTAALVDAMHRRAKSILDEADADGNGGVAGGMSMDMLRALVISALSDEGLAWRPSLLAQWPRVEALLRADDLVYVFRREDPARRVEETFLRSRSPKATRRRPQQHVALDGDAATMMPRGAPSEYA